MLYPQEANLSYITAKVKEHALLMW